MATIFSTSLLCSRHPLPSSLQFKSPANIARGNGRSPPPPSKSHPKQSAISLIPDFLCNPNVFGLKEGGKKLGFLPNCSGISTDCGKSKISIFFQANSFLRLVWMRKKGGDLCLQLKFGQNNYTAFYGRRGLIFSTTLPFLLEGFGVNALEVDAGDSPIILDGIRQVLSKAKAPGVLRLVFHDAGTYDMDENSGGMNGSIIYELDRLENAGLNKSVKILEKAKSEVDKIRPVSWADMIAMAGSEAVLLCGGPVIPVQLGRLDSMVPDPDGRLPLESLNASSLKKCFLKKGFSTQELVALSGAHTLGSKGFGNPTVFDNSYFKVLVEKPWSSSAGMSSMIGLPSDRALVEDDECLRWIRIYADDQMKFFNDFKNAYLKLVNTGAQWKNA